MPESPMKDNPLGIAARYNDAEAEEHGFPDIIERLGLKLDEVMYIAEQRALRVLAIEDKSLSHLLGNRAGFVNVRLTNAQKRRLVILQSAVLDGIVIGWRARNL